jgi:hypothetical protein
MRRRLAVFALLLLAASLPARAQNAADADCAPASALIGGGEPALLQVAPGAGRIYFLKNGAAESGCPDAGAACAGSGFAVPGDPVIVVGERHAVACATFTAPPPSARITSGWLPRAALVAPASSVLRAARDWSGDWHSGPEQRIRIAGLRDGHLGLHGVATFGAGDPGRVKRGAVNTGDFAATVARPSGPIAFLVGGNGQPLAYDPQRAKAQGLCGLRLWRLGPYLVVADNLQCGGNGVTFTGVYRRAGLPA